MLTIIRFLPNDAVGPAGGDDAPNPDVAVAAPRDAFSESDAVCRESKLLREYISGCVQPYSFITFLGPADAGKLVRHAFQLLAHPRKITSLKVVGMDPKTFQTSYNAIRLTL